MNETWIVAEEHGDAMTLLLSVSAGTLRVRFGPGPGRVVREYARRRRAWQAQIEVAQLARFADDGRVFGALLGDPSPSGEVAMSAAEARQVAAELRRCREHIALYGLPPVGTRVSVVVCSAE